MRVYQSTDFEGAYPTGTAAVIVAEDEAQASRLLDQALRRCGLKNRCFTVTEVSLDTPYAYVLNDGDY